MIIQTVEQWEEAINLEWLEMHQLSSCVMAP